MDGWFPEIMSTGINISKIPEPPDRKAWKIPDGIALDFDPKIIPIRTI
jgi:hypothetical protein